MKEELYQQIRNHSFNIAHFMTKNYHDAEDIAQIVSLKYLLNEKDVLNPFAWSKTVTKHEVYSRTKQGSKSEQLLQKGQLENYEDNLTEFMNDMEKSEKEVTPEEAKELLTRDDFRIFKQWLKCDFNVTKMAKVLKLSYNSAHTRVYKMKRNLRAQKLLKEGYTTSRDIIDYNTNKNIVKFIKMFVKKMKENDLDSLHSYLENIDKDKIECLDIARVLNYEVRLIENMVHEILIPHKDSMGLIQFCGVRFLIDKRKKIKVVDFISKPQKIAKVQLTKQEIFKRLPKIEKGLIKASKEEVEKILEIKL